MMINPKTFLFACTFMALSVAGGGCAEPMDEDEDEELVEDTQALAAGCGAFSANAPDDGFRKYAMYKNCSNKAVRVGMKINGKASRVCLRVEAGKTERFAHLNGGESLSALPCQLGPAPCGFDFFKQTYKNCNSYPIRLSYVWSDEGLIPGGHVTSPRVADPIAEIGKRCIPAKSTVSRIHIDDPQHPGGGYAVWWTYGETKVTKC